MTLDFETYLDALGEEGLRFADVAAIDQDAPVASCPGWSVEDLTLHLGRVYRMWHAQLLAGQPDTRVRWSDPDMTLSPIEQLEEALAGLLHELRERGPDAPCWNFVGDDLVSAWVARRSALETIVHRLDVESAVNAVTRLDRLLALDGIDEKITTLMPKIVKAHSEASLGGSICLVCADDAAAWVIEVDRTKMRVRPGRGPADAVLVGPTSELFLFVWNRVGVDALELTGSWDVAQAWRSLPTN